MIIPDVNLLVYAYNEDAPLHVEARGWWEECLSGEDMIGLPWAVIHGYLRLMTHPRVLVSPLAPDQAVDDTREWVEHPATTIIEPGPRHLSLLSDLLAAAGRGGSLTTDAVLAALAIENQATLYSNDLDFGRFPGLRWQNPLEDAGSPA
jgi:hypothetical protein